MVIAMSMLTSASNVWVGKHKINYIVIAASNSAKEDKALADFVCTGKNDEKVINRAIELLPRGGTIQLLDGKYFIDAFDEENHTAIYFGFNDGQARVINLVGDTENKGYNTAFGVTLHVTKKAFETLPEGAECRVFGGTFQKPQAEGDFYTFTHVNNVNFENFLLFFPDAQHPAIGVDARNFGSSFVKLVGIYTGQYHRDRFLHLKPATPVPGLIGFYSCPSSNDEMARIGYEYADVGGLHTGFYLDGVDHVVMSVCMAARCCYGYIFRDIRKTLTVLNCCDEGNTHLPAFRKRGYVTLIDFNIERFNEAFIPDDPEGNEVHGATVEENAPIFGSVTYTLQGKAWGTLPGFWEPGHGKNFETRRLDIAR